MTDNISLKDLVQALLILIGLLSGLAAVCVGVVARMRSDSWSKRWRYVLLGGGFGFLFGASLSAFMLVDAFMRGEHLDYRILPLLFSFSLVFGLLDAVIVFNSLWPSEWWRRHFGRPVDDRARRKE